MPQGGAEQQIGRQRLDQSGLKTDVSGANSILSQMHATMQKTAQEMAKGFDAVTASIKEMQSAMAKGVSGAGSGSGNSITKYISQIKHAMSELKIAYANVNKSVGIGDASQESYWRNQAKMLTQQTEGMFSNLDEAVNRSVSGMTKYGNTVRNLYQQFKLLGSVQGNRDSQKVQKDSVQQIKDAYDDLVRSIREYNAQIKNNDFTGANNTRSHIDALISRYSELEKIMSSSGLSGRNLINAESALQKMNIEAQKFFATLEAGRQQTVVQQIKDAYDDLTRSIKEYNSQVENGDYANASKTKQHIDELIRSYKELEETASKSGLSEEKFRDVNAILQNMRTSMNNFTKSVQDANSQVSTMNSLLQQAGERLLQMANQAILRGLSTMWREAISYTKTYYDSLNEIRIVTMRSQEEANVLGAQYRENAREQSVTSAEYVEGAASLFRQGLGDADVEGRLRQITVAAKTWGLDVAQTTELMTVAINAFNDGMEDSSQTAERIADVYSYVGRQNCPLAA